MKPPNHERSRPQHDTGSAPRVPEEGRYDGQAAVRRRARHPPVTGNSGGSCLTSGSHPAVGARTPEAERRLLGERSGRGDLTVTPLPFCPRRGGCRPPG